MRSRSYVLGLLVAGAGLGVAEFVNGLYDSARSPVVAVSEAFIEIAPTWLVEWAKSAFGTNDKLALVIGALIVITLVGLGVGRLAVAGRHAAAAGITTAMSVVGALAVVSRPNAGVSALGPTVAGLAASLGVLVWHRVGISAASRRDGTATTDPVAMPPELQPTRRRFLYGSAAIGALAVGAAGTGRALGRRFGVGSERKELTLPAADAAAETLGEVDVGVEGVTPFVISNDRFYRIDTAIVSPQVRASDWSLRIHGMVDEELTLTFEDLLARPQVERYMTLSCVSNEVGGRLVGNALWQGALLAPLLEEAGVDPGAQQLVSRSEDGWTCGTPVAEVMDGRDSMLAVRMNGEPLPVDHGYPVRMVVPGMYGYVSATKWVVEMELTTWDAFDAFWVPRGWDQQAPFKMTSRVDTPGNGATVAPGTTAIAGVAWHPHIGIAAVEVRIDDGPWTEARLADVPSTDTWRQWVHEWKATPGRHDITVRAVNELGERQIEDEAATAPNGASGYHTIEVDVSDA